MYDLNLRVFLPVVFADVLNTTYFRAIIAHLPKDMSNHVGVIVVLYKIA